MGELTTENTREHYSNYAFISYSRKDEKWAKWLQERLETYRLPASIRKSYIDLPSKIAPVFRDKTDLSGTVLVDSLYRELKSSKYLIVICSPNSNASEYVNKEIAYFASLGREKRIIPFIIDGEPFSSDEQKECFPRALRNLENELLGISVQELGKNNAFLRAVSTLLDLKYDQLVMRDTRRRRRRNIIICATGVVLAIILGIIVWHNVPHVKYYNAYVYRNEIPVGIYELSRAERKVSYHHYRFTIQRGKVIKVENVNSAGLPNTPEIGIATYDHPVLEFTEYDRNGRLLSVDQRDIYGQLISTKVLSYNDTTNEIAIDFHVPGSGIQAYAMSADMSYLSIGNISSDNRSDITRYLNTYDEDGLLIRSMYHKDNLGTPACDINGVYGKLYEYSELGQITRISNLNADGEIHNCRYGWATVEYVYDDRGNFTEESWLDAAGNRVRSENGSFRETVFYDDNNNVSHWKSLDEHGDLVISSHGFAEERWEYDSRGFMLSVKYYDTQGTPTYCQEGFHEIRYGYDDTDRCISNAYYDTDGNPMYVPAYSCASVTVALDDQGRTVQMWNCDTDGDLICDSSTGAYSWRFEYDENGYQSAVYYLDAQGKPVDTRAGYASYHNYTNALGKTERTEYRDSKGRLVRSISNYAIVQRTFDPVFGHWIATRYYDENGDPCYCSDGYAGEDYEYENGNLVSIRYVDTEGLPTLSKQGYHESRDTFENGKRIAAAYYDTWGNLVALEDGYAVVHYAYDEYGNILEKNYYDTNLQPVDAPNVYRIVNEFDDRGNKIRETGYAHADHGLPFQTALYEYDERGNKTRQTLCDDRGNLIEGTEHYPADTVYFYDAYSNLIREEKHNADGSYQRAGNANAVNILEYRYDAMGRKILERYVHADENGKENCLYQFAYTYDQHGNVRTEDHLNGAGFLWNGSTGYARILSEYDASGNNTVTEYYDENRQPTVNSKGHFREETDYNVYGEAIEIRLYGTDGKPVSQEDGLIACYRCQYDHQGRLTRLEVFNEYGEPYGIPGEDVAVFVYEYDYGEYGDVILGYDCEGELISAKTNK